MTIDAKTVTFSSEPPRIEYTYSGIDRSSYADYHDYASFFKERIDGEIVKIGIRLLQGVLMKKI